MRLHHLFPPPVPAPSSRWHFPRSWLDILHHLGAHRTSQALQPKHEPGRMCSGDNSCRVTLLAVPGAESCRFRSLQDQHAWHLLQ